MTCLSATQKSNKGLDTHFDVLHIEMREVPIADDRLTDRDLEPAVRLEVITRSPWNRRNPYRRRGAEKTGKKVSVPFLLVEQFANGKMKSTWLLRQSKSLASQLGTPQAKK